MQRNSTWHVDNFYRPGMVRCRTITTSVLHGTVPRRKNFLRGYSILPFIALICS